MLQHFVLCLVPPSPPTKPLASLFSSHSNHKKMAAVILVMTKIYIFFEEGKMKW
jgi:hypothetical protein